MAVTVGPKLIARSRDYGKQVVRDYQSGKNEQSRAAGCLGTRPIDNDASAQLMGRLCECAGAMVLGLNPNDVLNWNAHPDSGWDFMFRGEMVDVKGTWVPNGRCLIWPSSKTHFLADVTVDIFLLVKAAPFEHECFGMAAALGWTTKEHFFSHKTEADESSRLDQGTWFMESDDLYPMGALVETHRQAQ